MQYLFFYEYDFLYHFFFFFSSRRRHTRCGRDWSSDVCSSDLGRRDPQRLRQDEVEQGIEVALGPEGHADAGQLADLAAAVRRLRPGAAGLGAGDRLTVTR